MATDRTDFNESWLMEMPVGFGHTELYDMLTYNIKDLMQHGKKPISLPNNLKKIELETSVFYWYEINNVIALGVELTKRPQALVVRILGKNPELRNKEPYASDLYIAILNDNHKALRIVSDISLSDEGYSLWKRLYMDGHIISVYDRDSLGRSLITLNSLEEFEEFYDKSDSKDHERYQYVLTESTYLAETRSFFNTRRARELAGLKLVD